LFIKSGANEHHGIFSGYDIGNADCKSMDNQPVIDDSLNERQEIPNSIRPILLPNNVDYATTCIAHLRFGQLTTNYFSVLNEDVLVTRTSPVAGLGVFVETHELNFRQ